MYEAISVASMICVLLVMIISVIIIKKRKSLKPVRFGQPYGSNPGPSNGALVIVEPRRHGLLKTVIQSFSEWVPKDWTLYVVHGRNNKEFAREASVNQKRNVVFIELEHDNLNAGQYNQLLTNPQFWKLIEAEHILVFQTDSMPCGSPLDVKKFGKFGYIGCAYDGNRAGKDSGYWGNDSFYGVGGLSLRRKSFMLECLKNTKTNKPEDVTFSNCVDQLRFNRPTSQDIGDFCAQSGWGEGGYAPKSWGAHKINLMNESMRNTFLQYCPAASVLLSD
jgi:hypothetical protein